MVAIATCEFESHGFRSVSAGSSSNRKMLASHARDRGASPRESTSQQQSPVAQRRRLLPYKETIGGSSPSRTTEASRRLDTPIGRATRLKPECLRVRILLWALTNKTWLGRQLADHFGLEPEMLRVRIPPELLEINTSSWSSGVLACLSRRRSWVQIPSRTLTRHGTQTGKAAKLKPS